MSEELLAPDACNITSGQSRAAPVHLWKPGESGNPGGKPKNDLCALLSRRIFDGEPELIYKLIKEGLTKSLKRGDFTGLKMLADRAYGRLPQPMEHSGSDGGPIEVVFAAKKPEWLK